MNTTSPHDPKIRDLSRNVDLRSPEQRLTSRSAAKLLYGAVSLVAQRYGLQAMREACASLAGCDKAWASHLRDLPAGDGVEVIAIVARGILLMSGPADLRSALAFWASERDPAIWCRVVDSAA